MACYGTLQQVRVWLDDLGQLAINSGRGTVYADPELGVPKYLDYGDDVDENDRVSLVISGTPYYGFQDLPPSLVRNEAGEKIGGIDAIKAYFDSLGIGQPSGGTGGGITPEQLNTILQGYVPITVFNALEARVEILEQNAGYTQLDTPVVTSSNTTANSALLSWSAIANASGYEVYRNQTDLMPIATLTADQLNYPLTGLTAQTQYTPAVKALGELPYLDSDLGTTQFTTQQGGGAGNINNLPFILPFQFAS